MRFIRIILSLIITFCVLFTTFYGANAIATESSAASVQYKGMLTVWQIDGFEGGSGSRKQFLLSVARYFEKINDGVLVMVVDQSKTSAEENLAKGVVPDIISYSQGVEVKGCYELKTKKTVVGGKIGEKVFATPWCMGGYVLIRNTNITDAFESDMENLIVSQNEYTQPLTALIMEEYSAKKVEVLKPMDAYVKFVSGKQPYFLGTQRDVVRLNNRGFDFEFLQLTKYNDLYQYFSLTSTDALKREYAEKFIDFTISNTIQQKLVKISMLSPFIKISSNEKLYAGFKNITNDRTVSVFMSPLKLKEMQDLSLKAILGDENSKNKIKNILI